MRIADVSPRDDNTTLRLNRDYQSVSGKALCCTLSRDGSRAYLGGHSGVWRSDDGGATWRHLEWPEPPPGTNVVPGALLGTTVYDVLVSHSNPDVVFAAVGRDARRPAQSGIWRSADGGATWTRVHRFVSGATIEQAKRVWYIAVGRRQGPIRRAYAVGSRVWASIDGGTAWRIDPQPISLGQRDDGPGPSARSIGIHTWRSECAVHCHV